MSSIEISIIVPVYNEENNIKPFLERLEPVLEKIGKPHEIIFILDPSTDDTENVIRKHIERNDSVSLVTMTRRWGQNACLMAGIEHCRGNVCITIDVDLQDPPELIEDMYAKYTEGYDVVLTKRTSRKGESRIRLFITHWGYWAINKVSDVPIPQNAGDYRLLSRDVINELVKLKEKHGFLRGLIPFLGYNRTIITFDRDERNAGETKYNPLYGSIKHGWDGIVAFSIKPLTFTISVGITAVMLSSLIGIYYLVRGFVFGKEMAYGMLPVLLLIIFFGGFQLICLGMIGQYIGRIYEEVRERPKYLIKEKINF